MITSDARSSPDLPGGKVHDDDVLVDLGGARMWVSRQMGEELPGWRPQLLTAEQWDTLVEAGVLVAPPRPTPANKPRLLGQPPAH